ncbi:DUF3265 domain-containing protein [Vibrio vulnificus]|nr:DUF3265 domain-containing protein [Vibrio vulnificus]
MHAAWHFGYAVNFGGESGLRKVGLCGTHPLTRRYVFCEVRSVSLYINIGRFLHHISLLSK